MKRTGRTLASIVLFGLLGIRLVSGVPAYAQEERRERETRDARRERERKENENKSLEKDSDRIGRDSDRMGRDSREISRDSDRLDRKSQERRNDLARESERPQAEGGRAKSAEEARSERGFRNEGLLEEHYEDHKGDYGKNGKGEYISREEYLERAKNLRDTPADGKNILEIHRGDDRISKYDRRTNDFGVYERDGTVVTYYRPKDGEPYFYRQAEARKK
jgi:hypothetical protein